MDAFKLHHIRIFILPNSHHANLVSPKNSHDTSHHKTNRQDAHAPAPNNLTMLYFPWLVIYPYHSARLDPLSGLGRVKKYLMFLSSSRTRPDPTRPDLTSGPYLLARARPDMWLVGDVFGKIHFLFIILDQITLGQILDKKRWCARFSWRGVNGVSASYARETTYTHCFK